MRRGRVIPNRSRRGFHLTLPKLLYDETLVLIKTVDVGDYDRSRPDYCEVHPTQGAKRLDVLKAREVKLRVEEGPTLWHDCNLTPLLPEAWMKSPLTFLHHPSGCLYKEAKTCINCRRDYKEIIQAQANYYRKQGMPEGLGLYMTGLFFADFRQPEIREVFALWWQEVRRWSIRDQISLPYVLWQTGVNAESVVWSSRILRGTRHHKSWQV